MQLDVPITAAEIQGILTGLYAAGMPLTQPDWQQQLFHFISDEPAVLSAISEDVDTLQKQLKSELIEGQGDLTLLMPDDEEFIVDRAEALVYWCQGFVLGFQSCSDKGTNGKPLEDENSQEALEDIMAITQMDLDSISESEEDEKALFSLQEHTKISALLVFQTLSGAVATPSDSIH